MNIENILWEKAFESEVESYTANLEYVALRLWSPVHSFSNVLYSNDYHG